MKQRKLTPAQLTALTALIDVWPSRRAMGQRYTWEEDEVTGEHKKVTAGTYAYVRMSDVQVPNENKRSTWSSNTRRVPKTLWNVLAREKLVTIHQYEGLYHSGEIEPTDRGRVCVTQGGVYDKYIAPPPPPPPTEAEQRLLDITEAERAVKRYERSVRGAATSIATYWVEKSKEMERAIASYSSADHTSLSENMASILKWTVGNCQLDVLIRDEKRLTLAKAKLAHIKGEDPLV